MKTGVFRGFSCGGAALSPVRKRCHRRKVEEIIDLLDLQAARTSWWAGFPTAPRKLIELGRALALEPELLLLDEPCAGMNSEEKQDMIFWVKDIQDELGVTILLIEHDMNMVMDISDRILAINFGTSVITEGDPRRGSEASRSPQGLSGRRRR
jgi:branched-chain amino acid transport system ATP-binding protein